MFKHKNSCYPDHLGFDIEVTLKWPCFDIDDIISDNAIYVLTTVHYGHVTATIPLLRNQAKLF